MIIPTVTISDLVPDDVAIKLLEPAPAPRGGNVSALELILLAKLARVTGATTLFEIGTFDGRTTLNLAANSPAEAVVYTLDLPQERMYSAKLSLCADELSYIRKERERTGWRFRSSPYHSKIVQLWGDSAAFDCSPFVDRVDFVFIDGSHSYEYVQNDSRVALAMLRKPGGTIVWHDYAHGYGEVPKALEELFLRAPEFKNLRHVQDTTLVYMSHGLSRREGPMEEDRSSQCPLDGQRLRA